MKKLQLALLLLICILATPVLAQEDEDETLTSKQNKNGGFGGPVLKITSINDEFGLFIGGRGGWIINHTFVIGGGVYGLLNDLKVERSGRQRNVELSYGGLELELVVVPQHKIHFSVQTLIGVGGINDLEQINFFGEAEGPDDSFFIAEPGANLMWNMSESFRIGVGGSYRFIAGTNLLDDSDLSGFSVVMTFKFGRF